MVEENNSFKAPFLGENFLLNTAEARELYFNYAQKMPIIDYHSHLDPAEIEKDHQFKNLTEIWLKSDHYKWRAMRTNGVAEEYITGNAGDYEKFLAWAQTIPMCMGNPLYHWTHLELQRYFNIYDPLHEGTAEKIWENTREALSSERFTARRLLEYSGVEVVCTTDDPVDELISHQNLAADKNFKVQVLPTFRPDKGLNLEKPGFINWLEKLGEVAGIDIDSYEDFLIAMERRIEYFHRQGCRASDHALDYVFYCKAGAEEVKKIFEKALQQKELTVEEVEKYKTYTLQFLSREYHRRAWVMQLHIGAMRNNNSRMYEKLGPDAGFDSIGDSPIASPLSRLLDSMEQGDHLPQTVLYGLNPRDNYVLGTMLGNFQGGGLPGKMQLGPPWWFNDHQAGIYKLLEDVGNLSLLSRFIGMLTDSRSLLSFTRHEYFRRVLCDLLGQWAHRGEIWTDPDYLGDMVQRICYYNALNYFGFHTQ